MFPCWILNKSDRNCLLEQIFGLENRKKIAKFSMVTFTCRSLLFTLWRPPPWSPTLLISSNPPLSLLLTFHHSSVAAHLIHWFALGFRIWANNYTKKTMKWKAHWSAPEHNYRFMDLWFLLFLRPHAYCFWRGQIHYEGKLAGVGPGNRDFLGPVKWHRAIWGPKKSRYRIQNTEYRIKKKLIYIKCKRPKNI